MRLMIVRGVVNTQLSFSDFGFLNLSIFLEILVFFFDKYRYELCTCISMEIDTHEKISKIPVLIATCITHLQ